MSEEIIRIEESEYNSILLQAVAVIDEARTKVAKSVSTAISMTHWNIGKLLQEKKLESKHGSGVVNRLSIDLKERYPDMGLSPRQLWNMKKFYVRYADSDEKLLRAVAVLPWSHNLLLMSKKFNDGETLFYAREIIEKGWDRKLLESAIAMELHKNQPQLPIENNFTQALPAKQAEYANEVFKSQYNLGFLGVTEPIAELDLERRLVEKIKRFLMELGKGFTYMGNQYELEYNGKTSKVDMLFFHRGLHALVAIDLLCCAQHNNSTTT